LALWGRKLVWQFHRSLPGCPTIIPSPVNPLGIKGVGEAHTIACSPALLNAGVDGLSPLGVRHIDMPLKPARI
jgi:aerobic carbon-monoxide dehydrogenase large subunit